MSHLKDRLKDLGVVLPTPVPPVASYVPFTISGNTMFISGQLPVKDGVMTKGTLGKDITLEQAQEAAKLCAINILAQANTALAGRLERITQCLKLGVFVASAPDFTDHPKVANGASDFIVAALGNEAGKHARAAVGVAALPFGVAVEVEAIFEIAA